MGGIPSTLIVTIMDRVSPKAITRSDLHRSGYTRGGEKENKGQWNPGLVFKKQTMAQLEKESALADQVLFLSLSLFFLFIFPTGLRWVEHSDD